MEKVEPHLAVFLEQTLTESDPTEFHWFTQNVNVCIQSVYSTPHLSVCLSNILVNSIMLSATNKTAVLKGVALPKQVIKAIPQKVFADFTRTCLGYMYCGDVIQENLMHKCVQNDIRRKILRCFH